MTKTNMPPKLSHPVASNIDHVFGKGAAPDPLIHPKPSPVIPTAATKLTGSGTGKKKRMKRKRKLGPKTKEGRRRNFYMHVQRGNIPKTAGGITKDGIIVVTKPDGSKKYVSKARHQNAKHNRWIQAGSIARKKLITKDKPKFMSFKKGSELYNRTKEIYAKLNTAWETARNKAEKELSRDERLDAMTPGGRLKRGSKWFNATLKLYNSSLPEITK